MSWLTTLTKAAAGTGVAVAAITAAPVFGAAGAITAAGYGVATAIGASAAIADKLDEDEKKKTK